MAAAGICVCKVTHPIGAERASEITWDWISGTGGDEGVVSEVGVSPKLSGYVTAIQVSPGLNGDRTTETPTASYDIVINDQYGEDVAEGELTDCSASVAKTIYGNPKVKIKSMLTIGIINAGDTKKGRVIVHISPEDV